MKFSPTLALAAVSPLLLAANGFASTWTDDDSWKTSSPYYYGEANAPSYNDSERARESGRSQSVRRRAKARTNRELSPFAPETNNVSLDIGQNFLVGSDFQDAIGMRGTYTYGVSRRLAFSSSLGYSSHSNGEFSKLGILVGPRLNLAAYDRIIPYVNGGLGFFRASREINPNVSVSGTMFGLAFGGGADLQLTRETFFGASLAYHELFGTKQDTSIGQVDIAGNFVTFMAHVGYTF